MNVLDLLEVFFQLFSMSLFVFLELKLKREEFSTQSARMSFTLVSIGELIVHAGHVVLEVVLLNETAIANVALKTASFLVHQMVLR